MFGGHSSPVPGRAAARRPFAYVFVVVPVLFRASAITVKAGLDPRFHGMTGEPLRLLGCLAAVADTIEGEHVANGLPRGTLGQRTAMLTHFVAAK